MYECTEGCVEMVWKDAQDMKPHLCPVGAGTIGFDVGRCESEGFQISTGVGWRRGGGEEIDLLPALGKLRSKTAPWFLSRGVTDQKVVVFIDKYVCKGRPAG